MKPRLLSAARLCLSFPLASAIAALLAATAPAAFAVTISSSAGVRIYNFDPDANDTGALSLYNDGGGNIQRTFINFNLSAYSGNSITSDATLTLTAGIFGDFLTGVSLGTANSTWTQAGITWNNQPGLTAIAGATNPSGTFGSGPVTWNIPWYMLEKMATTGSGYNNGLGIVSGASSTQHFIQSSPTLSFSAATAASSTWTGGNGNWNDTANWAGSTVAQGIGQTATINGGTAVNITMDANRSVGALSFSGADHTISAGAGSLALSVTTGSPTIAVDTGRVATIGARLVGIDGFTKTGSGTLTLSGSSGNNTYTGLTRVTVGTLAVGGSFVGDGAIQGDITIDSGATFLQLQSNIIKNTSLITVNSGGTYDMNGNSEAIGFLAGSGSVVNSSGITLDLGSGSQNFSGALSGNANVDLRGANASGTQIFSGANTYTGATIINNGTLKAGSSGALGNTNGLSISPGAAFDLGGQTITLAALATNTGTITDSSSPGSGGILTISGSLGGGNNTLVTGSAGLQLHNGNGGTLLTNTANTYSGGTYLGIGGNQSRLAPSADVGTGTPGALTSGILGTGTIYIGKTTTDQGQIYLNSSGITINNAITYNSQLGTDVGGAIRLDTTGAVFAGTQTAGLTGITIGTFGGSSLTITGQITGSGTFTGTTSAGSNPYGTGNAVTNAGLIIGTSNIFGVATVILNNAGANNNYTGDTYITTSGLLQTNAANQLPSGAGTGNVYANGTLNLQGNSQAMGLLSGSGTVNGVSGTPTLTIGGNNATGLTFSGVIQNTGGSLALTKTGSGTQTLTGSNTYTGATNINGGTLTLGASNVFSDSTAVTVDGATSTLAIGNNSDTVGAVTLKNGASITGSGILTGASYALESGSISARLGGAGIITKTTSGTVTLTGNNTATGATNVDGGTFMINGASSSILTTVNAGGTLGGDGFVGAVTVANGGILAPGTSPGMLSTGNINLAAGSNLNMELNGATPITEYDQLAVTGTVTLAGVLNVTMGFTPVDSSLFFILLNDSLPADTITGAFSNAPVDGGTYTLGGQQFKISYFGDSVGETFIGGNDVVLMAVPEPNVAA